MIAFIRGELHACAEDSMIITTNGIGYELTCSANTIESFVGEAEAELHVYTHVREDQISLFGFQSLIEKKLFLSLIKVNGIGPKLAVTILSAAKVSDIVDLIENSDAKGLAKLPRIGKKTAEQMILSLKGQLLTGAEETPVKAKAAVSQKSEVVSALVNLGFRINEVEPVVDELDASLSVEDQIRKGLTLLTS